MKVLQIPKRLFVLKGTSAAHAAQGGRKQDKERRKWPEGFWVVGWRKQTTWVQIKLEYPQLFTRITRENKNISGALGTFGN